MSRARRWIGNREAVHRSNLRIRFVVDPRETFADLLLRGFDLAGDEIDLLYRTDAGLWLTADNVKAERQH